MVPIPTEEEKRWIEKEREKQRLFARQRELLKGDHAANSAGLLIFLFVSFTFFLWMYNYDPDEPVKRCAAYSNDGKLTCLRYEGENVSNGTIDPSDACVKRVKYSDGTYVDYGIHPDEYCPEY